MAIGTPTGGYKFRQSWRGKMVLVIEYLWHGIGPGERPSMEAVALDRYAWRDASEADLRHPNLRGLLPKTSGEAA